MTETALLQLAIALLGGLIAFGGAYAGVQAALARLTAKMEDITAEVNILRGRSHKHTALLGRLMFKAGLDMPD